MRFGGLVRSPIRRSAPVGHAVPGCMRARRSAGEGRQQSCEVCGTEQNLRVGGSHLSTARGGRRLNAFVKLAALRGETRQTHDHGSQATRRVCDEGRAAVSPSSTPRGRIEAASAAWRARASSSTATTRATPSRAVSGRPERVLRVRVGGPLGARPRLAPHHRPRPCGRGAARQSDSAPPARSSQGRRASSPSGIARESRRTRPCSPCPWLRPAARKSAAG